MRSLKQTAIYLRKKPPFLEATSVPATAQIHLYARCDKQINRPSSLSIPLFALPNFISLYSAALHARARAYEFVSIYESPALSLRAQDARESCESDYAREYPPRVGDN